jgi:hypothetical protein
MADVWDYGPEDSTEVSILVCLANFADDEGMNCFPGTARIARMTRYSERTVIRVLARLDRDGWMRILQRGAGAGHLSEYRIDVGKLNARAQEKGCHGVTLLKNRKRVTLTTRKGDTHAKKGDIDDNPPYPLFGRSVIDPSETRTPLAPLALVPIAKGEEERIAIERAVDQVCSALGIANRRKRRLLGKVIAMRAEKGEPTPTIALAMIAAANKKAKMAQLLRPMGLDRFFGEGVWLDEDRWPWDKDALREEQRRTEARVGSR